MNAKSGKLFYPTLVGAPTGRVGVLSLAIELPDNTVVEAPSTLQIVESSPSAYTATRTAPVVTTETTFILVWYDSVLNESATETLTVYVGALPELNLYSYCTATDVRAHAAPRVLAETDVELDLYILKAGKDIDRRMPDTPRSNGAPQFVLADLSPFEVNSLSEACAAQVLYRLHMGAAFFMESHQQVGGKDYSTQGAPPKFSPLATDILIAAGFLPTGGRAGYGRSRIQSTSELRWTW